MNTPAESPPEHSPDPASPTQPLAGRRAFVLTASDRCSRGALADLSGPAVVSVLREAGAAIAGARIVADERTLIAAALREAAAHAHLIVTTGGTGLALRDVTPEATLDVCDRLAPGLAECMRAAGLRETPYAALGRGVCGLRGSTLILNLPGSPAGAVSSLRAVLPLLPHALRLLAGETDH